MASISHSSTFTAVPPSAVTAWPTTSAPYLCAIWVSSFASDCAPVEVSACTNATTCASLFFFSASSSFCGSTGPPPFSSPPPRPPATADGVLQHAPAEHAVLADDDLVARRHHVDEAELHAH